MTPTRTRSLFRRALLGACLVTLAQWAWSTTALAADAADEAGESRVIQRWREATPSDRRAMRAELRERYENASPRERRRFSRRLKALERALPDFSSIERLVLLRAAAELPEPERKVLRRRLRKIDDLSPADRASLHAELKGLIRGFDGEAERLERNRERWQGMSERERDEYREQMKRLRSMSVEQRRQLLEEMERSKRAGDGEEEVR